MSSRLGIGPASDLDCARERLSQVRPPSRCPAWTSTRRSPNLFADARGRAMAHQAKPISKISSRTRGALPGNSEDKFGSRASIARRPTSTGDCRRDASTAELASTPQRTHGETNGGGARFLRARSGMERTGFNADGWERKRGKLDELNRVARSSSTSLHSRRPESIAQPLFGTSDARRRHRLGRGRSAAVGDDANTSTAVLRSGLGGDHGNGVLQPRNHTTSVQPCRRAYQRIFSEQRARSHESAVPRVQGTVQAGDSHERASMTA